MYRILRLNTKIKSVRIKMFGIWLFHVLGKRYVGVFLDPVLACNFRCRMCYYSDDEKRSSYRGRLTFEEIEKLAAALFHRALKFQIGCGAEPTLHKDLMKIITLGKQYKIPYISLTTNGALLNRESLSEAVEAGLNELTLSVHGFTKKTYEYLMTNGHFETFKRLLADVSYVKERYPDFKLRINYTINNDNLEELNQIWEVLGDEVDILQLRPIQNIGPSAYTDFDRTAIYEKYDDLLVPIVEECHRRNIICLVPGKENIVMLEESYEDNRLEQATYCYVSPQGCWDDDFDYQTDTFESYSRKYHRGRQLWRGIFKKKVAKEVNVSRKLNYNVK